MMTCGNGDMTIEPTEMTVFKDSNLPLSKGFSRLYGLGLHYHTSP